MNSARGSLVLGMVMAGAVAVHADAAAEDSTKVLPTLLIKGEVVSLESSDPAAPLLKVKDRYGFETPIFLTPETTIARGAEGADASALTAGTKVEVEYNFDVNTAKRHAVSVKVAAPEAAQASLAPMMPAGSSEMAPIPGITGAQSAPAQRASPDAAMPAQEAAPTTP